MRLRVRLERLLAVSLLCGAPAGVVGQAVHGRLLDHATAEPVTAATVRLLGGAEGDRVVASGVTDESGRFRIRAPAAGTYRLQFARIGYRPVITATFSLTDGDDALEVEVRAPSLAVLLDSVIVRGEPVSPPMDPRLALEGYYDRKDTYGPHGMGAGVFLEREDIMRSVPFLVSDVVRMLPGVSVYKDSLNRQVITFRGHFRARRCIPRVFVDGAPIATGADIDEIVLPSSLVAVELYTGLVTPGEFTTSGTCGAMAVWTGYHGALRGDEPRRDDLARTAMAGSPRRIALSLALSSDVASLQDSVWATLTISSWSDDTVSLCVTSSRFTVRTVRTRWEVADTADGRPCLHTLDLPPRSSLAWSEQLALGGAPEELGTVLIQKSLQCRNLRCGDRAPCDFELRSEARPLSLRQAR